MKKFFFTIVAAIIAVVSVNADTTYKIYSGCLELHRGQSCTENHITVTCQRGVINQGIWNGNFTITTDTGKPVKNIQIEAFQRNSGCTGCDGWTWSNCVAEWNGSDETVSGRFELENLGCIYVTVED